MAVLFALCLPLHAEKTSDPLWTLLSSYTAPRDEAAVAVPGESKTDAPGLASLQADLQLLSDGLESFRDESQVDETLAKLAPRVAPELRPFFLNRAVSLDTVYRTLAVTDYTWAARFPDPPCSPADARRKLLSSRDGLFQNDKGESSPWLVSLLGPQAEGASAEQALDRASAKTKLAPAEYEKRRALILKLTAALASDKAVGAARAKLYCSRAAAYEDLAASQGPDAPSATLAARASAPVSPEPSVFVVVSGGRRAAATMLVSKFGPVLVTDAAITAGDDHPHVFAHAGADKPVEVTATVARRDAAIGLATLTFTEDLTRPALTLADHAPAKDDLVTAVGHAEASGLWTKTSGLVSKTGADTFQTDAAVTADFSGGPVLNAEGLVVGLLVSRPADTEEGRWPVALPARSVALWLDGAAVNAGPASEMIEDAGTAAILNRTRPSMLTETAAGDRDIWVTQGLPPPPPTPRSVCVSRCGTSSTSGSYSSYSGGSSYSSYSSDGSRELGEALGKLAVVMITKGVPALFRGIAKLFKGSDKPHPTTAITQHSTPIIKEKPKPRQPRKPIRMAVSADRRVVAQGESIRLTAKVEFTGDDGNMAGYPVTFSADSDIFEFVQGAQSITDDSGMASVDLLVKQDRVDLAHQDLDREVRRRRDDAIEPGSPASPATTTRPKSKVEAAAHDNMNSLDSESAKVEGEATRESFGAAARVVEAGIEFHEPPNFVILNGEKTAKISGILSATAIKDTTEVITGKCPPGMMAEPPFESPLPGHPAQGSPSKALLEERCRPFENQAATSCGADQGCRNALLLALKYDFHACAKRWDIDGDGSPGALGSPGCPPKFDKSRNHCVPSSPKSKSGIASTMWRADPSEDVENDPAIEGKSGKPAEETFIANIARKLKFLFGKATGSEHNNNRSLENKILL